MYIFKIDALLLSLGVNVLSVLGTKSVYLSVRGWYLYPKHVRNDTEVVLQGKEYEENFSFCLSVSSILSLFCI